MGACFSRRAAPHAAPSGAAPPAYSVSSSAVPVPLIKPIAPDAQMQADIAEFNRYMASGGARTPASAMSQDEFDKMVATYKAQYDEQDAETRRAMELPFRAITVTFAMNPATGACAWTTGRMFVQPTAEEVALVMENQRRKEREAEAK